MEILLGIVRGNDRHLKIESNIGFDRIVSLQSQDLLLFLPFNSTIINELL